jgi:serine/threonine transporter
MIGIILAVTIPEAAKPVVILGSLFVGALKAIAPVLVLFLVMSAIAGHKRGQQTNMKSVIFLYLLGTLAAGLLAVIVSFIFPLSITLSKGAEDLRLLVVLVGLSSFLR